MRFTPQNMARGPLSMADYLDVRASGSAFDEIAAYSNSRLDVTGGDTPEQVIGVYATPSLFNVLGARPLIGRTFLPDEDKPDGVRVMLLSEALWRRRFNADPAIVGTHHHRQRRRLHHRRRDARQLQLSAARTSSSGRNMWMVPPTRRGPFMFTTVGRLRPGATLTQAQAEMTALGRRIEQADAARRIRISICRSSRCATCSSATRARRCW